MIDLSHPASLLSKDWTDTIRTEAVGAEKHTRLTKKQLNLIYEQGWFKMLIPSMYGGKQLSLPEVIAIEEALAYADGSLGWVVTLCAGAGWFGGFMESSLAANLLSGDHVCLAGSGALKGTAELTATGYLINGKWPYASGTPEASSFTANCIITQNGKPVKDEKGNDKVIAIVMLKNEVTVTEEWNSFGMRATGSHAYEVKNLKINSDRAFDINELPTVKSPLYYFPFYQLAEATLCVNMTGMGVHFMELCGKILEEKSDTGSNGTVNREALNDKYNMLLQKLNVARQKLFYAVDMSWQVCLANKEISPSLLYKISAASFTAVHVVRDCVNTLFPYCGLKAADKDSEINRVWRDIHTAGQHAMLAGDGN
ncbi:acyl-CoA dehydrogenase [Flavipsychrobacter stenotrophus]|uniref:Acyl-CoA dehydrogenase n=1 Tax=Flavipsychrobacter stenotrophus TaxID=2077091 RepID=A0A2S7T2C7_9BACT|nr:acyl-CoA dehydrogenase family protein [Flavipsychrobacter stenotrophus]PQJ13031.1 acyl-CoA dehydrogenase [Flavipsychrobacter stenotrophus]